MTTDVSSDPFAAPTDKAEDPLSQGGGFVPLAAMATGRLVLIVPVSLERKVLSGFKDEKTKEDKYGPKMVAHIAVLSGESEFYWTRDESAEEFEAPEIPHVFENVFINSAPLIDKTEAARRTDVAATMTVGLLTKPKAYDLRAANEKHLKVVREWLATPAGKAFHTTAQELHDARVAGIEAKPKTSDPFSA